MLYKIPDSNVAIMQLNNSSGLMIFRTPIKQDYELNKKSIGDNYCLFGNSITSTTSKECKTLCNDIYAFQTNRTANGSYRKYIDKNNLFKLPNSEKSIYKAIALYYVEDYSMNSRIAKPYEPTISLYRDYVYDILCQIENEKFVISIIEPEIELRFNSYELMTSGDTI